MTTDDARFWIVWGICMVIVIGLLIFEPGAFAT